MSLVQRLRQLAERQSDEVLHVHVGLDAYPDLTFSGVVDQISPIGQQSTLSPKVRNFIVLVLVNGAHPNLMPDLTAPCPTRSLGCIAEVSVHYQFRAITPIVGGVIGPIDLKSTSQLPIEFTKP